MKQGLQPLVKPRRKASLYYILLLSSALPTWALAEGIVEHRFISQSPNASLEDFLYMSAAVELSLNGFSSTRSAEGADLVLLAEYVQLESVLEIRYGLFRPLEPSLELAFVELAMPIDYELDAAIASAIRQLLKTAAISPVQEATASIQGVLPIPPSYDPELAPGTDPEPLEPAVIALATGRLSRYRAAMAVTAIFFIGDAAEYFKVGAGGYASFGFSWPLGTWKLGLDANASISKAFNAEDVVGGPLFVTQAGLAARAGYWNGNNYWMDAILSGGAAILSLGENEDALAKTVPYAELGLALGLPIYRGWYVGVAARYLAIFDQEITIMGIVPTLALGLEF